jgi:phytoene dehydrogenase-like protein
MTRAVVVGSGPNGLAAALTLAKAGLEVQVLEAAEVAGGGTRSSELTLPGLIHDECSGFHPLAVDTAFSREFDLRSYGLTWRWPDVQFSHPLDDGKGAASLRSVQDTAANLGTDGRAWRRVFAPLTDRFDGITEDFLKPMLHLPAHPISLGWFGFLSSLPAAVLARNWSTPEARALFGGVAAHAMRDLRTPMSSAIGVALGTAAHAYGWPVAEGGSAAISTAMIAALEEHGGKVITGVRVESLAELASPDVLMLDTAPAAAARIVGDRMPGRIRRAFTRYRHGPGVFKLEYAIDGDVPWQHEASRRAGTVHVIGDYAEISLAERLVAHGVMPERPFVLVGQQYLADPTRSSGGRNPLYAYAHVPAGYTGDASAAIESQIERFAPGFRDRILARHVRTTTQMETHNPNYVGGDVVTGANTARQLVFRPRVALNPYTIGVPGVYLCSAATPPGAGAHGMCGYNAAQTALARLSRRSGRAGGRF